MKAWKLKRFGPPEKAFELETLELNRPAAGEVLVETEGFGLNFADIMARKGLYRDCPPLPAIIGYESVGRIKQLGAGVTGLKEGDRVVAFSRFGAYATHVITQARAVVPISENMPLAEAAALATQYVTAWFAACEQTNLFPGDVVLIHGAAGGVGTALVQIAKMRGCRIIGTVGNKEKVNILRDWGVEFPINYREKDFGKEVEKAGLKGKVDVIFDPVGGSSVKKGMKLLNAGGRMICYGMSAFSRDMNPVSRTLGVLFSFGFYHPGQLMLPSQSIMGVNMLRIADHRPEVLERCLRSVVAGVESGNFKPVSGGEVSGGNLPEAHRLLESGKTIGKVAVRWD